MELTHFLSNCLRKDPADRVADLGKMSRWAEPLVYDRLVRR